MPRIYKQQPVSAQEPRRISDGSLINLNPVLQPMGTRDAESYCALFAKTIDSTVSPGAVLFMTWLTFVL